MILNVDFALRLSNFTSLKRFKCLKWNLKNFSPILRSHFNYHTLPLTLFKVVTKFPKQWQICITKCCLFTLKLVSVLNCYDVTINWNQPFINPPPVSLVLYLPWFVWQDDCICTGYCLCWETEHFDYIR